MGNWAEAAQVNALGWPDKDMLTAAMGIIVNVDFGEWSNQREEWQAAAKAWVGAYHRRSKSESMDSEKS